MAAGIAPRKRRNKTGQRPDTYSQQLTVRTALNDRLGSLGTPGVRPQRRAARTGSCRRCAAGRSCARSEKTVASGSVAGGSDSIRHRRVSADDVVRGRRMRRVGVISR